jgi:hypothetical protein
MSLTLLGGAALMAAASRGHESYVRGCDVLGAELPLNASGTIRQDDLIHPATYRTQVASGITVLLIWTIFNALRKS